jgi:uncharacterized protein YkwD
MQLLLSRIFSLALALTASVASPAGANRPGDVEILLSSMNEARMAENLPPLRLDRSLSRIAYAHAVDMARRRYYAHVTPEGVDPFARMAASHIRFGYAGENLAVDENAENVFNDFWNSREHRSNMLGEHYVRVGIGSVEAAVGTIVVEDFAD